MDINKLKKEDWLWLFNHRCRHGHRYIEHMACYVQDYGDVPPSQRAERVAFFDIEASNLDANFGIMISWVVKELDKDELYIDHLTQQDIITSEFDKPDKRITQNLINVLSQFDRVVGHYSSKFDLPFVRTRALYCGLDFPAYGQLYQDDTWSIAKSKLKLNSNRLDTIAQVILGKSDKTRIEYKYWLGALHGDKESIDYIVEHNKIDVIELEKVWKAIHKFQRPAKRSI
jgi:uncharacterized protein YprB with RNaseH-like and TPR domain